MMERRLVLHVAVAVLLTGALAQGAVIYVDVAVPSGQPSNGTTWTQAHRFLATALAAASADDTILVAGGTYYPDHLLQGGVPVAGTNPQVFFDWPAGARIEGGCRGAYRGGGSSGDRDIDAWPTILSGDIGMPDVEADNSKLVMQLAVATVPQDVTHFDGLDGVEIVAGRTNQNLTGAGLNLTQNADVVPGFFKCRFADHLHVGSSDLAGGAAVMIQGPGDTADDAVALFADCVFEGNRAKGPGGAVAILSGWTGGSPGNGRGTRAGFVRCRFEDNAAIGTLAGAACGGAVQIAQNGSMDHEVEVDLVSCTFVGNHADEGGDAIGSKFHNDDVGQFISIQNGVFHDNDAGGGSFDGKGGAIYALGLNLEIVNSTFADNEAEDDGGALYRSGGSPSANTVTIHNSILFFNTAPSGAQIYDDDASNTLEIRSSTLEGDEAAIDGPGGADVWDANLESLTDPLFLDRAERDYRLDKISPCINAGDSELLPPDRYDLDADSVTNEPLSRDSASKARFHCPEVELGAFEACHADVDCDGVVTFQDLVALLANWGACPAAPDPCPWDINEDGDVGFSDLLALLAQWSCGGTTLESPPQSVYDCLQKYNDPGDQAACIEAMILAGTP